MFKKIQVNSIKQQQAMGFMGNQEAKDAIAIIEGKDIDEEKKLKKELNDIAKEELDAQKALIEAQRQVTASYLEMAKAVQEGFFGANAPQQQPQAQAAQPVPAIQPQAVQEQILSNEETVKPKKRYQNISFAPKKIKEVVAPVQAEAPGFIEDKNIVDKSFQRHTGEVLGGMEKARAVAEQFKNSLGANSKLVDANILEGNEKTFVKGNSGSLNLSGQFQPSANKAFINKNATSSTVDHELSHQADFNLTGGKSYASEMSGTFQNTIAEQIKPRLIESLKAQGLDDKAIKYRTENKEIFADLMANTTPAARQILTSTKDPTVGMQSLKDYETKLGTNIPGFAGIPISKNQAVPMPSDNTMSSGIPSFEPMIATMRTFTETLQKISDSFSNITMTHTLNIDGQINIAGVNTDSIATQLRDSLGEYIGQVVTEEFKKRNATIRTS
jgi:hypothetical protein